MVIVRPQQRYFNSHTREGVTNQPIELLMNLVISTHTPVRV